MKLTKTLGVAAIAVLALLTSVSSASATTLEVGGVAQSSEVKFKATLAAGTSVLETATGGGFLNTCQASTLEGHTSAPLTGTVVGGPITALSWSSCTEANPTVDAAGTLTVERIGTTTNGTVRWTGGKITEPSVFGNLTCTTSNTDIGTLTGVASGNATMDINGVLSCTIISTANWTGTYTFTSPTGLGVTG